MYNMLINNLELDLNLVTFFKAPKYDEFLHRKASKSLSSVDDILEMKLELLKMLDKSYQVLYNPKKETVLLLKDDRVITNDVVDKAIDYILDNDVNIIDAFSEKTFIDGQLANYYCDLCSSIDDGEVRWKSEGICSSCGKAMCEHCISVSDENKCINCAF